MGSCCGKITDEKRSEVTHTLHDVLLNGAIIDVDEMDVMNDYDPFKLCHTQT
jgi:hypothetical protein